MTIRKKWALPVKLSSLEPRWVRYERRDVGVSFLCPHCNSFRVEILFLNPGDGLPSVPRGTAEVPDNGGQRWARSGLSWDELSLSPSVDAPGHWHGYILDGSAT